MKSISSTASKMVSVLFLVKAYKYSDIHVFKAADEVYLID